jgi:hypothetical protein
MEWGGLLALTKEVGPVLTVVLAVLFMLSRDMLITRGQVERLMQLKDQIIQNERDRGDEWKAATVAEREARVAESEQLSDLLEVVEVHTVLLRAIQEAAAGKKAS